jgi:hypothetical protein
VRSGAPRRAVFADHAKLAEGAEFCLNSGARKTKQRKEMDGMDGRSKAGWRTRTSPALCAACRRHFLFPFRKPPHPGGRLSSNCLKTVVEKFSTRHTHPSARSNRILRGRGFVSPDSVGVSAVKTRAMTSIRNPKPDPMRPTLSPLGEEKANRNTQKRNTHLTPCKSIT